MGNKWPVLKFKDLYLTPSRNGLTKPKAVRGTGYKFINMGEIFSYGRMLNIPCDRVELTEKEKQTSLLMRGDLLFARQSLVLSGAGKCSIFLGDDEDVTFDSHLIRVRLNTELINPEYLYYYFLSPQGRKNISTIVEQGAGQAGVRGSDLENLDVPVPPKKYQDNLVALINDFDTKCECNNTINQTLEQMAQTLFKSWFIDFDPVIDNALDAGNDIPDTLQERAEQRRLLRAKADFKPLPAETRALFPSEFEETELGWVPKGWVLASLGDVSNCFDSKRIPLSKQERELKQPGSIPYYGATSEMDLINEWIFDDIYLLMGEDGSVMKEDGTPFLQYIWGKSWVNNHAHVLQGKADISTEHLLVFLQQCDIKAFVTGAVQLKLNQKNMNSISFVKAIESINLAFQKVICPLFDRRRQIEDESRILRKLRDSLLPKLISGELALDALPEMPELAETR